MNIKKAISRYQLKVFDKNNLTLKKLSMLYVGYLLSLILLIGVLLGYGLKTTEISHYSDGVYVYLASEELFSEDNLQKYIEELNIQHPKVVFAQSKLETSNFKSPVFLENHNLFGMKLPSVRATTAVGEQYNHAVYSSWKESVLDYALRQCKYGSNIATDKDYIKYLGTTYAEDSLYEKKLTEIYNQIK